MNRIQNIFKERSEKLIPFITAGFPNLDDTMNLVLTAEEAGADMIEIGMPFSDPLADGPIIQQASHVAINNGVTIRWILDTVSKIREKSDIPIALMGYINPLIKYGFEKFVSDCSTAGVDGLIIPDLPPEEAGEYICLSKANNISPILLVAPNTTNERIAEISRMAGDLIYCVAILGITGTEGSTISKLKQYLQRVEAHSQCAYIVGFGIKERIDVIQINEVAHGAVVGSALIKEIEAGEDVLLKLRGYVENLKGKND